MGMTCTFVAVSDRDLPDIQSKPLRLLTFGDTPIDFELLGLTEQDAKWQTAIKPRIQDVDKAWDGMNFLLNKASDDGGFPYTFINEGGLEFEDDGQWGYGPPRLFTSDEIQEIARVLKDLDIDDLNQQTDPQELVEADVYCMSADEPPEESMGYFTHHLSELKIFIAAAAADKLALIVYLA
jgi:hypothetical protein